MHFTELWIDVYGCLWHHLSFANSYNSRLWRLCETGGISRCEHGKSKYLENLNMFTRTTCERNWMNNKIKEKRLILHRTQNCVRYRFRLALLFVCRLQCHCIRLTQWMTMRGEIQMTFIARCWTRTVVAIGWNGFYQQIKNYRFILLLFWSDKKCDKKIYFFFRN